MKLSNSEFYGGRLKNSNDLLESSSGGAFTALSDMFLKKGDAVVCSTYNYSSHQQEFCVITSKNERNRARGSKYVQAVIGDVFIEAEKWLNDNANHTMLFVGTGCQAAGFRRYAELRGFLDRVIIVDLICHGVPSPKVWQDYISYTERRRGKVTNLSFKDKRFGWNNPTAYATAKGQEISLKYFVSMFYSHKILRPACHVCPYATIERESDITIGDFWHIDERLPEFYNELGTSLIILHTTKGKALFNQAKECLDWFEATEEDCIQQNLVHPTPASEKRERFWRVYRIVGICNYVKYMKYRGKIHHIKERIKSLRKSSQ